MALAGRACLLLFLAHLPSWDSQTRPQREPDPDVHTSVISKTNLKEIIKLLDHRIQVLHQKNLMHEHENSEKEGRPLTVHMNLVKGSSVKGKATPSSPTTQEIPFPNNYSVLMGNKLYKIFPYNLLDTPMGQGTGTEEDKKERPLLPGVIQDKNAGNNGGRAIRTTNITVRFHSADNSSKTQIDIYNLKDSREVPEVHVVASNIFNQDIKTDSVILKDNGLQVIVNSSVDKQVNYITENERRKALIKLDHGIAEKSTIKGNNRNLPPAVIRAYEDSSQSIMRQSESPVKELENILNDIKKESEMQEPSSPTGLMQSSVMENILQDLEEHPVEKSSLGSEIRAPVHMESSFSSEELQGTAKTDSSKDRDKMPIEPYTAQVSNEIPLNQPLKATSVPDLNPEVTDEDINDAKRFEFFEKYEGIQDKKRAKAADLKDLLKHIIIACVAVTSLILAVIVLVHIYTSLFIKKKKQEPVTTNKNTDEEDELDQTEITSTEEKGSQQLLDNTVDIENQNTVDIEYQNVVDTEYQNVVDIENQNNNNLSSPPAIILTDCEVRKPFKTQPVETIFSPRIPPQKTDVLPSAECLVDSPDCSLPSLNNIGENLKVQPRTFKRNHTSSDNQELHSKLKDHDYKRFQSKDTVPHRKKLKKRSSRERSSRHGTKSIEPQSVHTHGSPKQQCYSNPSSVHDSSKVSLALDTNENTNESNLFQHDGSVCACQRLF